MTNQNTSITAPDELLRRQRDEAYIERNCLVAALSKLFPAWMEKHDALDETWDNEWMNIVYVDLPSGQVSWHIHDSEVANFEHLQHKNTKSWDGHSTAEKYERLAALPAKPTPIEHIQNTYNIEPIAPAQSDELVEAVRDAENYERMRDMVDLLEAKLKVAREGLEFAHIHVEHLKEAFRSGALESVDGNQGLRSNINHDVFIALEKALKQSSMEE